MVQSPAKVVITFVSKNEAEKYTTGQNKKRIQIIPFVKHMTAAANLIGGKYSVIIIDDSIVIL